MYASSKTGERTTNTVSRTPTSFMYRDMERREVTCPLHEKLLDGLLAFGVVAMGVCCGVRVIMSNSCHMLCVH